MAEFGYRDRSSFDSDETSYDSDERHTIKRTLCSCINTLALIATQTTINRVIAGKRCWNAVGHELGLYTCARYSRLIG